MLKQLTLTKRQAGKKAVYEVIEDGKILAKRTSHREYYACTVSKTAKGEFYLSSFFGRPDLMRTYLNNPRNIQPNYGIATRQDFAQE